MTIYNHLNSFLMNQYFVLIVTSLTFCVVLHFENNYVTNALQHHDL